MTKSELIERFAKRYPHVVIEDAEVVVQTILEAMCNSLTVGNRVEVRGFGVFHLRYRLPRDGRNPKSGEVVQVPAKYVPHFKAGKQLRERARAKSARRR